MTRLVAIDPGDKHVGIASFKESAGIWACTTAWESTPEETEDLLSKQILEGLVDILVVERWRLYPDKAKEQAGSEMETAQMIGVLKYIVRTHNAHVERHAGLREGQRLSCACRPGWIHPVELVTQPADVKRPTKSLLASRKLPRVAPKTPGDHAMDAELHGWHHIIRTLKAS